MNVQASKSEANRQRFARNQYVYGTVFSNLETRLEQGKQQWRLFITLRMSRLGTAELLMQTRCSRCNPFTGLRFNQTSA